VLLHQKVKTFSDAWGDDKTLMTISHERLPPSVTPDYEGGWGVIAEQLAVAL
jgi:hypothetical protein